MRSLYAHNWVVYAKKPFGGPQHVLHYLGRYTHRVAVSNHRLLNFSEGRVTFRWKDYTHGGRKRRMTLTADEFLRRFLLHVLPRGFVRIRHFGWLANRHRTALVALCRSLLAGEQTEPLPPSRAAPARSCPSCGGAVHLVEALTAAQLGWRPRCRPHALDTS